MTLSQEAFRDYVPAGDEYANKRPQLKLDDLQATPAGRPKISYLMSTYNRQWQLARTLETLARQTFREFEVLLMDDGSTQDLQHVLDLFRPYLQLHYFRQERNGWTSCPSRAFKYLLPHTLGEIIAIGHPEMMLDYQALDYVYKGCNGLLSHSEAFYWTIDNAPYQEGKYWVSFKPQFLDDLYWKIDTVDWHTDLKAFQQLPNYWRSIGFSAFPNTWHAEKNNYPWWFVGATKKSHKIWQNLPEYRGHGIIDMWLCDYRRLNGYREVVPYQPLCYHQPHLRTAIGVEGEQADTSRHARKLEEW